MFLTRFLLLCFPLVLFSAANIGTLATGQTTSYDSNDDGTYQKGQARSFTHNGDDTVTDNVTGLMWQDDATVDVDTYTWANASTQCDGLALAGQTDWRLPTAQELSTLVDASQNSPAIDPTFQNTASSNYWSSTAYAPATANAWRVYFSGGNVSYSTKTNTNYVRCVRGDSYPASSFSRSGNIVTDSATGLQWQDDATGSTMNWTTAITTCENLSLDGYADWRLPNRNELQSIMDYDDASAPLIDGTFQNTASNFYWSSTTYAPTTTNAWNVCFADGNVDGYTKTNTYYVRCVRAGTGGSSGSATAAPIGPFGLLALLLGILGFGGWSIRKR